MSREEEVHESVDPSDVFRTYTGLPKTHIDQLDEIPVLPEVALEGSDDERQAPGDPTEGDSKTPGDPDLGDNRVDGGADAKPTEESSSKAEPVQQDSKSESRRSLRKK